MMVKECAIFAIIANIVPIFTNRQNNIIQM